MKKTLAAATIAALVGAAGAANASDIYPSSGPWKGGPSYYVPPVTWTGFYIGGHVGGAWGGNSFSETDGYNYFAGNGFGGNNSGVFGGGTLGYNFQAGSFVLGFEADFGGAGLTNSWNNSAYHAAGTGGYLWSKDDASFYADVTGRLGYAAGPALFYIKGGWAYLDNNTQVGGYYAPAVGGPVAWSTSSSGLDGWTAGGGIEYLFAPCWSVKAEYLYFDFSGNNYSWANPALGKTYGWERDYTVDSFKVGVNYHFGNVYAPLK